MSIYLGDNNITGGFTAEEKKQFNNSINLINEQLDKKANASDVPTREDYQGNQSVDVRLNGRCAFVISSQYGGVGCAYLLLSNYNAVCSVVKLGGSDEFKVTATHKSNSVDTITVSTRGDDYSWYIVYM